MPIYTDFRFCPANDICSDNRKYIVLNWLKSLFDRNDDVKFEEVRLWIALIYDDFNALSRPDSEVESAVKEVYIELGLKHEHYAKASNRDKCEALHYFLNHCRKRGKLL